MEVGYRIMVGFLIIYSQTTTHIDVLYCMYARCLQPFLQFIDTAGKGCKVVHLQYLTADVEVQAYEFHAFHFGGKRDDMLHILHVYAKFVFSKSSGDVGVCVSAHIGVYAQGYACLLAFEQGKFVDDFQFGYAFHVEGKDACFKAQFYFPIAFPHSGIDDFVGGEAGLQGGPYLASADAIGSETFLGYDT